MSVSKSINQDSTHIYDAFVTPDNNMSAQLLLLWSIMYYFSAAKYTSFVGQRKFYQEKCLTLPENIHFKIISNTNRPTEATQIAVLKILKTIPNELNDLVPMSDEFFMKANTMGN
mmetsp:Transcript_24788/g.57058  ORF Transcript_24788/g.57058 Transcript_24788/m.57058 type:complete len:115 (+) Transcript_24788:3340-3684(+)